MFESTLFLHHCDYEDIFWIAIFDCFIIFFCYDTNTAYRGAYIAAWRQNGAYVLSLVTKGIGLAKKIKHRFDAQRRAAAVVYLWPVRRIERVKTTQRICAMTFDDGPCLLPPQPGSSTMGLTEHLAQVLERHGAKGTFDVVGDTSQNYPDVAGKEGSAQWGGVSYEPLFPIFGKSIKWEEHITARK